jgi:hypothetical protein
MEPDRLREIELFAWLGEDELGSGIVGIKQGLVPAGCIPLVATTEGKMKRGDLLVQLNNASAQYGKRIYLCRFKFEAVVWETPEGEPL